MNARKRSATQLCITGIPASRVLMCKEHVHQKYFFSVNSSKVRVMNESVPCLHTYMISMSIMPMTKILLISNYSSCHTLWLASFMFCIFIPLHKGPPPVYNLKWQIVEEKNRKEQGPTSVCLCIQWANERAKEKMMKVYRCESQQKTFFAFYVLPLMLYDLGGVLCFLCWKLWKVSFVIRGEKIFTQIVLEGLILHLHIR